MKPEDFKHQLKVQIRFKDVDKQGHVNNANHLTYFETARVEYFKDVVKRPVDWNETGMILARTEIDYFVPILLEDDIYCYTKVASFGTKSFVMNGLLTKKTSEGEIACAKSKFVIVCFNYQKQQTIEVPQEWKQLVNAYELK